MDTVRIILLGFFINSGYALMVGDEKTNLQNTAIALGVIAGLIAVEFFDKKNRTSIKASWRYYPNTTQLG